MLWRHNLDGLVQERRNSIANALGLPLSCINSSILYPMIIMRCLYIWYNIEILSFTSTLLLSIPIACPCHLIIMIRCLLITQRTQTRSRPYWWPCNPWEQGSWGQHGTHLGPTGPRWATCWSHEPCYLGCEVTPWKPVCIAGSLWGKSIGHQWFPSKSAKFSCLLVRPKRHLNVRLADDFWRINAHVTPQ